MQSFNVLPALFSDRFIKVAIQCCPRLFGGVVSNRVGRIPTSATSSDGKRTRTAGPPGPRSGSLAAAFFNIRFKERVDRSDPLAWLDLLKHGDGLTRLS